MKKKPQEFYVTIRIFTDPEVDNGRKVTEKRMEAVIKKAFDNVKEIDDVVDKIRLGDVIDVTK